MKELLETGVSISLVYNKEADALVGRIKEYAVAVRENNETMSYGCLIWVKKGEFAAIRDAESYLAEQVTSKPDVVKHFKVSERGIAVALVKTKDSFTNINNIKRFLTDLAGYLSLNFYQSCCCYCGSTEHLGIYLADGAIVQACSDCGKDFTQIVSFDDEKETVFPTGFSAPEPKVEEPVAEAEEPAAEAEEAAIEEEPADEEISAADTDNEEETEEKPARINPDSEYAVYEEAFRNVSIESAKANVNDQNDFNALLAEAEASIAAAPAVESAFEKIDLNANKEVSFDSLIAEEKEEETEPVLDLKERKSSITEEEYRNEFSDLIPDEKTDDSDEKPFFAGRSEAQIKADQEEFAALMDSMKPDGESDSQHEMTHEEKIAAETKAAEGADYTGFMFDPSAEKEEEDPWKNERREVEHKDDDTSFNEFMISEQERDKVGQGELDIPEQERDTVGHNEDIAVTEYADDSNEGEDIDVEEIESTTNKPTDTSGEQIEAKETPLEEDGSVPLINPNSAFAEVKPSEADGPDAVQPLESREIIYAEKGDDSIEAAPVKAQAGYSDGEDPRAERPKKSEPTVMAAVNTMQPKTMNPNPVAPRREQTYSAPAKVDRIRFGSNPAFGIIGALALGAVGVLLWILISSIGGDVDTTFRSGRRLVGMLFSLASFAIIGGVFFGYKLGGDELDTKGIVISSVITIIYDAIGIVIKNVFSVQSMFEKAFGYKMSFGEAVNWTLYQFGSGNNGSLVFNFWATIALMVIMLAITVRYLVKKYN